MTSRFSYLSLITLLATIIALGCSGSANNDAGNPMSPDNWPGDLTANREVTTSAGSHVLWGTWEIHIESTTLEVDIIPLRGASFNANITQFMQPPAAPINLIGVYIDSGASNISNGLFAVDISLSHPFPGMGQFSGFDVRGVFIADGSVSSLHYGGLTYADEDEGRLLNADGWTRWWNPSEFTSYGTIFGYTPGSFSTPGFQGTASLNGYKYYCDGLGAEDELVIDPDTRGFFSTVPGVNTRRFLIQFPSDGITPEVKFNYAVDASWDPPDPDSIPNCTPDDYSLSANCQEAYQISVADAGSTAWFVDSANNGGDLLFDITVYDWQSVENPDGVPGEVAAISIESPDLMDTPVNVLPALEILPDGPTSSVFRVEVLGVHPTGLEDQTLMIAVESASPPNYAPNVEGISGFDFPDEPLAAYLFWDAPIGNEQPNVIPSPTGLDNCAAAGVVELFWNAVVWADLAGYNVYRKESTVPDYDFDNPLNPSPIAETHYLDLTVLDDGTTYDYVVTAVDLDTTESDPSNETQATPVYNTPTGFTDLDIPDGTMGTGSVANVTNAFITGDGMVYLVQDWGIYLIKGDISDGSYTSQTYIAYGACPDVAVDSNGVAHLVWSTTGVTKTYYYASVDTNNQIADNTQFDSFYQGASNMVEPSIALTPDDEIHIVYPKTDGTTQIYYIHGSPGDFSTAEIITSDAMGFAFLADPCLAADHEGNLHMVYTASGYDIHYMKRDTDGVWSAWEDVESGLGATSLRADMQVDLHGVVHVAWNRASGGWYPWYNSNAGGSWGTPLQLWYSGISNGRVGLAIDRDSNVYIDWYSDVGMALVDKGKSIVESGLISDTGGEMRAFPSMAGILDPCYTDDVSVMGFWKLYPTWAPPQISRIQTDY